jgi:riboflavin synthase
MFTGLIQQVGRWQSLTRAAGGWSVTVGHVPWPDGALVLGESVAVQGACLTVARIGNGSFHADLLDETLARTALGALAPGAAVNLERALRPSDRLGGHLVSGHIDETGRLEMLEPRGRDWRVRVRVSHEAARQTVRKGSVALDGISLTVADLGDDWVEVHVIPHTWQVTSLAERKPGDPVNVETDILGKYVARLLGTGRPEGLTLAKLEQAGFFGA